MERVSELATLKPDALAAMHESPFVYLSSLSPQQVGKTNKPLGRERGKERKKRQGQADKMDKEIDLLLTRQQRTSTFSLIQSWVNNKEVTSLFLVERLQQYLSCRQVDRQRNRSNAEVTATYTSYVPRK